MFFFMYLSSISIFDIEKKKNKIINCLSLNEFLLKTTRNITKTITKKYYYYNKYYYKLTHNKYQQNGGQ